MLKYERTLFPWELLKISTTGQASVNHRLISTCEFVAKSLEVNIQSDWERSCMWEM